MIAIGVLILGVSFVSTMFALLQPDWIDAQLKPHHEALSDNPLLQRPALTWLIAISGGMGLIESGLSIGLGLYILRAKKWAIVTSLVLTMLRLAIVVVLTVPLTLMLFLIYRNGDLPPEWSFATGFTFCGCVTSIGVLVLLAVWLMQALRIEPEPQPTPSS